jgi:hypothetical protein
LAAELSGAPSQGITAGQMWSGAVTCAGFPQSTFWVGDMSNAGKSLACYDEFGAHCLPGVAGCPCVYPASPPYNGNTTYASYNNPGAGNCVVCPAIPAPPLPPSPSPSPPPPPPQPMPTSWSTFSYTSSGQPKYQQQDFRVNPGDTLVTTINSGMEEGATYSGDVSVRFVEGGTRVITLTPSNPTARTTQAGSYLIVGTCSSGNCRATVAYGTVKTPTWAG